MDGSRAATAATLASLFDLMRAIPDERAAIGRFAAIRWRDGALCPRRRGRRVHTLADGRTHKRAACRERSSIEVGAVFEDSKVPLRKWLAALRLMASHRKGTAGTQLAEDIKVTQRTA